MAYATPPMHLNSSEKPSQDLEPLSNLQGFLIFEVSKMAWRPTGAATTCPTRWGATP